MEISKQQFEFEMKQICLQQIQRISKDLLETVKLPTVQERENAQKLYMYVYTEQMKICNKYFK